MSTSPFLAMQKVEGELKILFQSLDFDSLADESKKMVNEIRRVMVDTRLDIRDYELSETRDEQLKNAALAKKRLARLQKQVLAAGDVFSAVDTAKITAELDQINDWLQ
jgi:hypothetical protein